MGIHLDDFFFYGSKLYMQLINKSSFLDVAAIFHEGVDFYSVAVMQFCLHDVF